MDEYDVLKLDEFKKFLDDLSLSQTVQQQLLGRVSEMMIKASDLGHGVGTADALEQLRKSWSDALRTVLLVEPHPAPKSKK